MLTSRARRTRFRRTSCPLALSTTLYCYLLITPGVVGASSGVCDSSPSDGGASELACMQVIQAVGPGAVVHDVFHDKNGRTGDQLSVLGQLLRSFPGCNEVNSDCNGNVSTSPGYPTQAYPASSCENAARDYASVAGYVAALDWKYASPARLQGAHGSNGRCPDWSQEAPEGSLDGYGKPWEGLVFDLGGPSSEAVLFAINAQAQQPCGSIGYTIYFTNNPTSTMPPVEDPDSMSADPQRWNRAKLSTVFLEGWKKVRPGTDPGLDYTVEADSFATVWTLPCGTAFRYLGVVVGNDGHDLAACAFDTTHGQIDAVAGLTQEGAGICPDADADGFVACTCPGAPTVCDCNDADPAIHPGARELCDGPQDMNCDGMPGSCGPDQRCYYHRFCAPPCWYHSDDGLVCADDAVCDGTFCRPVVACANDVDCPTGDTCDPELKLCTAGCENSVCPIGQVCRNGNCEDSCAHVACPPPQVCDAGRCKPPCTCSAGDSGCSVSQACDVTSGKCVSASCLGTTCPEGQRCNSEGVCVGLCEQVACPDGQKCVESHGGCVPARTDVVCSSDTEWNLNASTCLPRSCSPACATGTECQDGLCVGVDAGPVDLGHGGGVNIPLDGEGRGCSCRIHGGDVRAFALPFGLLTLFGLAARRRRSSRRGGEMRRQP